MVVAGLGDCRDLDRLGIDVRVELFRIELHRQTVVEVAVVVHGAGESNDAALTEHAQIPATLIVLEREFEQARVADHDDGRHSFGLHLAGLEVKAVQLCHHVGHDRRRFGPGLAHLLRGRLDDGLSEPLLHDCPARVGVAVQGFEPGVAERGEHEGRSVRVEKAGKLLGARELGVSHERWCGDAEAFGQRPAQLREAERTVIRADAVSSRALQTLGLRKMPNEHEVDGTGHGYLQDRDGVTVPEPFRLRRIFRRVAGLPCRDRKA